MKNKLKEIGRRLKNTGTIIAIASGVIGIILNLGFNIDGDKIMYIINTICTIGVAVGVLNNPTTNGASITK